MPHYFATGLGCHLGHVVGDIESERVLDDA